jgi:hypothetical protein
MAIMYRPQQNGMTELENRTIVEMTRNVLHAQNLLKYFLAKAVANAV